MSIMCCDRCGQMVDTDFDLGSWEYEELPDDPFYCQPCADEILDEMEKDKERSDE